MTAIATCPECVKRYRVPHTRKEWRCKACDVPLEVEAEEPDRSDDEGNRRREAPPRRRREEKRAGAQMRKAAKGMRLLRLLLKLGLFFCFIALIVIAFVAWAGTYSKGSLALQLAILAATAALSLYALYVLERHPFPVALSLALLQVANLAYALWEGELWIIEAIWTVVYGYIAISAARLSRLAKQYPDLYFSRKMRGEEVSKPGTRTSRLFERERRKSRRRWILASSALGLLTLIGVAGLIAPDPPSSKIPEALLDEFAETWNAADVDRLAGYAGPDLAQKRERFLRRSMERLEWGEQLPAMIGYEALLPSVGRLRVTFETVGGDVPCTFEWRKGTWAWTTVKLGEVTDWRP